ncbi:hypothetical protein CHCC20347_3889 [Bacillus paralicheniformis]|uniref:Uncharacterized protein n=1 Tax=Bacillus paralicheniformis TaxID=1648923 RepID=A0ABY3FQY3_9BACI|nr:hypothetical protein CHCC20347_3889 [Bacillus paralicheniformis]TWL34403.1 hypothetical protein CHCC15381_4687 [Bacillus paralicheniformis]
MGVFGFVVYFIHIGNFDRHNWRNHFLLYIFQKIQEMEQLKENRRKIRRFLKTDILRKPWVCAVFLMSQDLRKVI